MGHLAYRNFEKQAVLQDHEGVRGDIKKYAW